MTKDPEDKYKKYVECGLCGKMLEEQKTFGGFDLSPHPSKYYHFCSPEHRSEFIVQQQKEMIS